MRKNRAQDRFYLSILEKNLKFNEKTLLSQINQQDKPDTVEGLIWRLVVKACMPKQYECKLRTALSNMGCMQIIKRGEGVWKM